MKQSKENGLKTHLRMVNVGMSFSPQPGGRVAFTEESTGSIRDCERMTGYTEVAELFPACRQPRVIAWVARRTGKWFNSEGSTARGVRKLAKQ